MIDQIFRRAVFGLACILGIAASVGVSDEAVRRPPPGCLHHTYHGSQYCAHDYHKLLRKNGFKVMMSGKGICCDNSAATLKSPSSNTSTAFTIPAEVTQPQAGNSRDFQKKAA